MLIGTLFSVLTGLWAVAAALAVWSSATTQCRRRRILLFASWSLTSIVFGVVGTFLWALRDGLGPDSAPSTGFAAVRRFARDAWLPSLIIIVVPTVCSLLRRARFDRKGTGWGFQR
jgi:hypothetical protein